jgi:glucosamine 6-phosphate synthetase-like amidotransferase/phosphosugar isomerase protein
MCEIVTGLTNQYAVDYRGIGATCWATHGSATGAKAHSSADCTGRIAETRA